MRDRTGHRSRPHTLYRLYDAGGAALYIGLTVDLATRLSVHRCTQPWWPEVAEITSERYPNYAAVHVAEREAIQAELPKYNRQLTGRFQPANKQRERPPGVRQEDVAAVLGITPRGLRKRLGPAR